MTEPRLSLEPRSWSNLFNRDPFSMLRSDFDNALSRWFGTNGEWGTSVLTPAVDLSETDTHLLLKMDLPGIQAKDLDIQLHGNVLTVTGEQKEEKEEKGRTWHRVERRSGKFARSFQLPCSVEEANIAAEFKDGVLNVSCPKTKEARPQKIKVKA